MPLSPPRRLGAALASTLVLGLVASCSAAAPAGPSVAPSPTATGYRGAPIGKAAEPGEAPEPTTTPVGRVVPLPEGTRPWGVAAAKSVGKVYLAARKQNLFAVYDMATGLVASVPVPGSARMIDLVAPEGPLLLPAENGAMLYTLALPSLEVVRADPTRRQPHQGVQVGGTTFVTEEYGHAVRAIRDGKTVADLTEPVQPGGIAAAGTRVAAVDVKTNLLFVYDATTLKLVAALPAGKGPSHVVSIGDGRVAVCDVRGNQIITYDLSGTPRELGRAAVPGRAFWVVADPASNTIYAALSNTNKIAKLSVSASGKPRLVTTVPTVQNPISFDRDPVTGNLYVGGFADSELQIIPASAFE
ncbi:MAG: hypothetical protein HY996_04545 [Micrococcales bacterium]|nr:hypothetical protein [Micrococcales bacterium]